MMRFLRLVDRVTDLLLYGLVTIGEAICDCEDDCPAGWRSTLDDIRALDEVQP